MAPSANDRAPRKASACPRRTSPRNGYDLSLNRYKEVVSRGGPAHRRRKQILAELAELEQEIEQGMRELEGMREMSSRRT